MLRFERTFPIDVLADSPNLAEELSEEDLKRIGIRCTEDFEKDLSSRSQWDQRMADALKIAMQVTEKKSSPWVDASNVLFPLITIAALQYHARAYPALVSGTEVVKCRVIGPDPHGEKTDRAERISLHMSYQLLEEDECWEEEQDRTLIVQSIMGCAFKKTYFDPLIGHNVSELVLPKNLVVPYYTKSLKGVPRVSHVIYLHENDLYEREARGIFLEKSAIEGHGRFHQAPYAKARLDVVAEDRQGLRPTDDPEIPYEFLEVHRYLDLDGDGYQEPYIVTVHRATSQVLRIVARYFSEGIHYLSRKPVKIERIEPLHMFTKYPFIPSPDGGFYDLGFGSLLLPLNESINTSINQLIDAGTLVNRGGGFLGRGVKILGGEYSFRPGEWKRTDSPGQSLKDNIFPNPVPQPSEVLLSLLSLLISYGERTAGATEMVQGLNPGQNTPASTAETMTEQGLKILNGVYKRTYRSMRDEFRKLYALNKIFLPLSSSFEDLSTGESIEISVEDYQIDTSSVKPSADPELGSENMRIQQAIALNQASQSAPGYNIYQVQKRLMKALKVPNIEEILPDPAGPNAPQPPEPDVKLQIAQLKSQESMAKFQAEMQMRIMELVREASLAQAKIVELEAQARHKMAQADQASTDQESESHKTQIEIMRARHDVLMDLIEFMRKMMKEGEAQAQSGGAVPPEMIPGGMNETGEIEELGGTPPTGGLPGGEGGVNAGAVPSMEA